jgi:hypothetical protein
MAVDTNLKRSSSTQMLLLFLNHPAMPSGTFTVFVRQALAHTYAGIQALFSGVSILRQMIMHHGG